ncbi:MAG: hypothetical protein AAB288_10130, partial [Acidobacteriota bacterium]
MAPSKDKPTSFNYTFSQQSKVCAGGGQILVAQSTFVEIECDGGERKSRLKIHYKGKQEANVKPAAFHGMEILDSHPLLFQYNEPSETIYLSSRVQEKRSFISLLEGSALKHFKGWRTLYSYVNPGFTERLEELLDEGFGILMDAPKSFADQVLSIAKSVGVDLHTRPGNF